MKKYIEKAAILLLYFTSSVSTTIINKLVVSVYMFPMHYFFILAQSLIITAIIAISHPAICKNMTFKRIQKWAITSFLLTLMIFTNMKTLYYFPVTLFTLYKNLAIVPTAFLELHLFEKKITICGYICFFLIIASSYTAHITDHISLPGYIWMAANISSTTIYMLYLKKLMTQREASRLESVFYTNLLSIPILAVLSITFDPVNFMLDRRIMWALIVFSSLCALITSFSTAWALEAISTTAVSMLGALNKLVLSVGGLAIFKEKPGLVKMLSLAVGIFASALYSYDSIKAVVNVAQPAVAAEV